MIDARIEMILSVSSCLIIQDERRVDAMVIDHEG